MAGNSRQAIGLITTQFRKHGNGIDSFGDGAFIGLQIKLCLQKPFGQRNGRRRMTVSFQKLYYDYHGSASSE